MADRTDSLWRRFAGMFGAEALARKYGESPPPEWRVALDRLKDFELERGLKRLVFSGKQHVPSLPEFLRMCREVGGDYAGETPVPPSHQIEAKPYPQWLEQGNRRLLDFFNKQAAKKRYFLTQESLQPFIDAKNYWVADMQEATANNTMPADNGKAWWHEYFEAAEKQALFNARAA